MGECVEIATPRAQAVTFFPMGYKGCETLSPAPTPRVW
jgi:hypothetical protein